MSLDKAIGYFDGACLPQNPGGVATYGWVLYAAIENQTGDIIDKGYGVVCEGPGASNNRGEYGGVIAVMTAALKHGVRHLLIRGDSQLIVRQLKGEYRVKSENLIESYQTARGLASCYEDVRFEWVARELNSVADRLSEIAYEELTNKKVKASYRAARKSSGPSMRSDSDQSNGPWKDQAATAKQINYLRALGCASPEALTRGEASETISRLANKDR